MPRPPPPPPRAPGPPLGPDGAFPNTCDRGGRNANLFQIALQANSRWEWPVAWQKGDLALGRALSGQSQFPCGWREAGLGHVTCGSSSGFGQRCQGWREEDGRISSRELWEEGRDWRLGMAMEMRMLLSRLFPERPHCSPMLGHLPWGVGTGVTECHSAPL